MSDAAPNMDLNKGFWVMHSVIMPDGRILTDTISNTPGACIARTERLLNGSMPPNWKVEEVVVVRRKAKEQV